MKYSDGPAKMPIRMKVFLPTSLEDALGILRASPGAHVLAGGTDFMVEMNYGHRRPERILSLRFVDELRAWSREGATLVLGAGVRFADILSSEIATLSPALAQAARTVGSPQIRNTGTIGGNIATASPAGDTLPVLWALEAMVNIRSEKGERRIAIRDLVTGVKRNELAKDELITSISIPVADGPQEFLKVGRRNAMVIAAASLAFACNRSERRIACALGAVGPTIIRCTDAERFVGERVDWERLMVPSERDRVKFGELCSEATLAVDDHRSTARYRRHAISVMACRAVARMS